MQQAPQRLCNKNRSDISAKSLFNFQSIQAWELTTKPCSPLSSPVEHAGHNQGQGLGLQVILGCFHVCLCPSTHSSHLCPTQGLGVLRNGCLIAALQRSTGGVTRN